MESLELLRKEFMEIGYSQEQIEAIAGTGTTLDRIENLEIEKSYWG